MKHGSLFSGIGGFDLAAEWMGWENIFHCEWNPFGQKVLKHYWPQSISYNDITKTDFTIHRGKIDILTGGFPCQPYSMAGKRKGKDDERHLWPEMLRAIREIQPRWIVGENVLGLVNWSGGLVFEEVQADLEAEGYEVQPYVLPAAAVNAPHRRDRVWFVAKNTKRNGFLFGEPNKEGTEVRQFGNPCTGSSDGIHISKGVAADTTSNGFNDQSATTNNSVGQDNIESGTQRERAAKGFGNERAAADTNLKRFKAGGKLQISSDTLKPSGNDTESNVTDTKGKRCERQYTWDKKFSASSEQGLHGRSSVEFSGCETWQNFPTQSPICTGDDGLPSRLDGITFSKWRNESIKAAGNAIVPQVVLQIFKSIEQYDTTTKTPTN
jgi:DNA (cytosine-5)-methyltransferase 1